MEQDIAQLVERLAQLETGQVADVLAEAGLPDQALSADIRPTGKSVSFAGVALCARGRLYTRTRREVPSLPNTALDSSVFPGAVVMIDTGGFVGGACMGGLIAASLQRGGAVAVVSDGAVRDVAGIDALGLPTFARVATPVAGARRWGLVALGEPISMPGQTAASVIVHPGDLVLGDADGVVVIPQHCARGVVEDTEELGRIEARMAEALQAGRPRADVFKENPRFDHVRPAARAAGGG
jgi:4-hydroxy-4-methyl-2-oxoglutarate aldolase